MRQRLRVWSFLGAAAVAALGVALWLPPHPGQQAGAGAVPQAAGRIHGVVVTTDRVEDVTRLEAIAARLARYEAPRALAEEIFRLVVKFRHQATPPCEFLETDHVHDPIRIFNVYGYCQCCGATAAVMALGRLGGLRARGRELVGHTVPELFYAGAWHMYDASLINWFPDSRGQAASVDAIARDPMRFIGADGGGFIDAQGWLPARTARESDLRRHYGRRDNPVNEPRYSLGHRAVQSFRQGETLVRNWDNQGRYLDGDTPGAWPPPLVAHGAEGSQAYLAEYFAGYAMGLIGNGTLTYAPALESGGYRGGVQSEDNIATRAEDGASPALHLARPGRGEIVFPFTSGYVFLGGRLTARVARATVEDRVGFSLSLNGGRDWVSIGPSGAGSGEIAIDLGPHIARRYRYLLRAEIAAGERGGTGIESLVVSHEIQHAQRALPLLGPGVNRVTVSAPTPAIATRTLEGSLDPSAPSNASFRDFHPEIRNLEVDAAHRALYLAGADTGTLTYHVEVPGAVSAVRFGGNFRVLDPSGRIRLQVSDDGARTWKTADTIEGPVTGTTRFVSFPDIAPATRRVAVRYEFSGSDRFGIGLYVFRIDVDYRDPRGGVRPVRVTYDWMEGGVSRTDTRTIAAYPTTYTIETAERPVMRSVRIEGL